MVFTLKKLIGKYLLIFWCTQVLPGCDTDAFLILFRSCMDMRPMIPG